MEISCHLNPNKALFFPTRTSFLNFSKFSMISCVCKTTIHAGRNNLYQVLSLESERVGFDEIKKAYRSMALKYHPDVCHPSIKEESTRKFVELQWAYETLSNPISRTKYDNALGVGDPTKYAVQTGQERSSSFPDDVWKNQIEGLQNRSLDRIERKRKWIHVG